MRIAFAITELDIGGAERALVQLVSGLPREEWEPRVYCLGPWGPLASTLRDAEVAVKCLDAVHLWDAPRILWQLTRELRRFQPEILQSFLFHANILGRLAGAIAGVPHIVSGIRVADRRSPVYGWIDRWTNGLVERNVCVSRGVAEFCQHQVGLDPRKTVIIPNGVDVEQLAHATPADVTEVGLPPGAQVLLTVGRLEPQKGIDILLEAAPQVLADHPGAWLVVIGDGPDRDRLTYRAQSGPHSDRVAFLGRRDDVPRWLKAAYALVLPSRWEGMPNVVLEAMAAGTPVIATRVEGVGELLVDGATGLLVPPEAPPQLAEVMNRLLRQPELARALANAAQDACKTSLTTEATTAKYVALYRELLRRSSSETTAETPSENS